MPSMNKGETTGDLARVLNGLEESFGATRPPKVCLPNGVSFEARRAADFFQNRRWQDVTLAVLRQEYPGDASACLEFLAPESGLYLLPAYLRICAESFRDADVISDTLERQLADDPSTAHHFGSLQERLTSEQKAAVANVLAYIRDHHESDEGAFASAAHALAAGWDRYLRSNA
jgi:hypothetical protein